MTNSSLFDVFFLGGNMMRNPLYPSSCPNADTVLYLNCTARKISNTLAPAIRIERMLFLLTQDTDWTLQCTAVHCCQAENTTKKSQNQTHIRPYFYQKLDQKRTPTCYFQSQKQTCSKNLILTRQIYLFEKFNICGNYEVILSLVWMSEKVKIRLFGLFGPKSGLFKQKEEQFGSIFQKGPLSDQGLIKRTYLAALQCNAGQCRALQSRAVQWKNGLWAAMGKGWEREVPCTRPPSVGVHFAVVQYKTLMYNTERGTARENSAVQCSAVQCIIAAL